MSNLRSQAKSSRSPQSPPASPENRQNRTPGDLTWALAAPRDASFALFVDGQQLATRKDREAALEKLRAGQLTRLEIEAVTYIQTAKANRNFVRFKPGMMPGFAKSFAGQPFLKDHASRDLMSRGGTILSSKLEHLDPADGDGESDTGKDKQIRMRIELVKAWAIESALDGTLDRFSIGWSRTGPIECSYCEADIAKCYHWPGDQLADAKKGGTHTVQFIFTAADGTETSGVNVPAVVGTGIEAISLHAIDRLTLSGTIEVDRGSDQPNAEGNSPMDAIKFALLCTVLGISATASPDQAIEAAEKLRDERDDASEKLEEEKATALKLATEEATRLATERATTTKTKIAALVKAGKLKAGGSAKQQRLERLSTRDHEEFLSQCDEMLEDETARVTPAGKTPVVLASSEVDAKPGDLELAENPHLPEMLRKAGITKEQYEKHGASARANVERRRNAGF